MNKTLCFHTHTTGIDFNHDGSGSDQAISVALSVFDIESCTSLDALYILIKPNDNIAWVPELEAIHGLSLDELNEKGNSLYDACNDIATFILKHFDLHKEIPIFGYNVNNFHLKALKNLFYRYQYTDEPIADFLNEFKFSERSIDLYAISSLIDKFTVKQSVEALISKMSKPCSSLQHINYYQKMYKFFKFIMKKEIQS